MSAEEIRKYDPEDKGLKGIMGEQFHDGKFPDNGEKPVDNSSYDGAFLKPRVRYVAAESAEENKVEDARFKPVRSSINVAGCARTVGFGGLTALLFYWEHIGLMAETIAVPSMIACAALFGLGIGKAVR